MVISILETTTSYNLAKDPFVERGITTYIRLHHIFNIFTGKTKDFSYIFRDGTIYCKLENCKVMHSFDGSLNLNIYASLKDYKGINNYITSENFMKELLENEIRDTAYELYNDTLITDNSNLHWYCIQSGEKCGGVNINVFII